MPGNIGLTEIIIVLVVALLVFGPKKLPEMGRGLGKGMREFKESLTGDGRDDDDDDGQKRAEAQAALPPAAPPPAATAPVVPPPPVASGSGTAPGSGTPR